MHPKAISPSLVERMVRRRGTAHIHLPLDPRRTALIVVDMQNAFLDPGTDAIHVPNAVSIVPNVNRLAGAMRRAGGKVFWLQHSVSDESRGSWSNFFAMGRLTPEDSEKRNAAFAPGSFGHRLHDALEVGAGEARVCKFRYGPFGPGASDLDARLREANVDTLVIAGTLTNVCCETTAREAMMLNYKVIMVEDAAAALSDEEHAVALSTVYTFFGDVATTDELVGELDGRQS